MKAEGDSEKNKELIISRVGTELNFENRNPEELEFKKIEIEIRTGVSPRPYWSIFSHDHII